MLLDLIVLIVMIISAIKGFSKGLILGIFSFIAFVVGLAAAIKFSAVAAAYIGHAVNMPSRLLPFVAFFAVFILVSLFIRLVARIIEKTMQISMLGWANRLGGVTLYVFLYLFIFSVFLFYIEQLHILKLETLQSSVCYPFLKVLAPQIINGIGVVIPFFKNMFAELLNFFQNAAEKSTKQYTLVQTLGYSTFLI